MAEATTSTNESATSYSSVTNNAFMQQQTQLIEQRQKLKHYESLIIFERNHSSSLTFVSDAELTPILASISDLISASLAKLHFTDPFIDVAWLLAGASGYPMPSMPSLNSARRGKSPKNAAKANNPANTARSTSASSAKLKQQQQQVRAIFRRLNFKLFAQ